MASSTLRRTATALGRGARIRELLRARLASRTEGERLPFAALLMQVFVAGVLCGLVRDDLPPFAYGTFALALSATLVALPLLGDLGALLTVDEADEWVRALPVDSLDVRLARLAHLLIVLVVVALGALVPAALVAPASIGWPARLGLVLAGLAQALAIAAALVALLTLLGARAHGLLVLLQTLLFGGAIVGGVLGLQQVDALTEVTTPLRGPWGALPPAWFAAFLAEDALPLPWRLAAPLVGLGGLALLLALPPARLPTARRGAPLLSRLLRPLASAFARVFVRRNERATFELVFEALPREREFVLRTYPLVGIPLAFLLAGSAGSDPAKKEALLALLLFTPCVYLPILVAHLPASRSAGARWILDTAPVAHRAIHLGALKAMMVRFLLPLYAALGALAWFQVDAPFALRMTPPAALVAVLVLLELSNAAGETDPPLSRLPEELEAPQALHQVLGVLAMVATILAVVAARTLTTTAAAALASAVLLALVFARERRLR